MSVSVSMYGFKLLVACRSFTSTSGAFTTVTCTGAKLEIRSPLITLPLANASAGSHFLVLDHSVNLAH